MLTSGARASGREHLGAAERTGPIGILELNRAASEVWDEHGGRQLLVAVRQLSGWALMFEDNGFIGVTEELMEPVSAGTEMVSHFRNVNALSTFLWLEDGGCALSFEPLFPRERQGTRATEIEPELVAAGFDMSDGSDRDLSQTTTATFALAERVTGIPVTEELLDSAEFFTGVVAVPGSRR